VNVNVHITHVIVHEPQQVREIIAEAGRIADDAGVDPMRWDRVFEQACRLLGERYTFAMPQTPVQLPAMAIPGLKGH